tara:strand:- start:345925 stop:347406 length:1482 start_codon:yes stop_codon:yes gene_type:complete
MELQKTPPLFDVAVIGGGINGVAVARNAALRGLRVFLCEKNDLASGTSFGSTKLIHGGLRYLEQNAFWMVRKSLKEREILARTAPHMVEPMGFIIPHGKGSRPRWLVRAGLFIYDHLARTKLFPKSKSVSLDDGVLKPQFKKAFRYTDGWTDDCRLTVLNAVDAADHGAEIATRTACISATYHGNYWEVTLSNPEGHTRVIHAKTLVNAAGPWAEKLMRQLGLAEYTKKLTLVKGSHIVVPKLFDHEDSYLLQHTDGRVIFAIPYQEKFTLIGTTDTPVSKPVSKASEKEIEYLCDAASRYFKSSVSPDDVVWSFSGVRPLIESGDGGNVSKASRDFEIEAVANLPLISIWGGKLTTHRLVGEKVVDMLAKYVGHIPPSTTHKKNLVGHPEKMGALTDLYPWLPKKMAQRFMHAYGSRSRMILEGAHCLEDLGTHFGADLYEAEVNYLFEYEFAQTGDDILWRRSKQGLYVSKTEQAELKSYIRKKAEERDSS